ncbi:MAG: hemin import ATP-binding protein HmuV [Candidatus Hydrogenedentota bacterium]
MLEAVQTGYRAHNGQWLLRRVSLSVQPGRFYAIAGANGAGKTTLLRLLCGEMPPSEGCVTWQGRSVATISARQMARTRACLGQNHEGQFPFTAYEVALMGRTPHLQGAYESAEDHAIVRAVMDETDVSALANRHYPTLSGGEATRTHVARILAQDTAVVLLDEPTNHLDLRRQVETLSMFRRKTAQSGMAVVAVLHDLNLASLYADELLVLQKGVTVTQGAPRDVLTPELVRDAFGLQCVVWQHPSGCPWVVPVHDVSLLSETVDLAMRDTAHAVLEESLR